MSDKLTSVTADHSSPFTSSTRFIASGMSGTSADGVDIAIVRIDGRGYDMTAQLIVHHHRPYNQKLREQIFAFRGGAGSSSVSQDTLRALAEMGREISLTYAAAVNEALAAAHMEAKDLAAVAAHGQTLFHDPPNTIQWLDPSLIAAEVGCVVVSDFRRADLAAGGQGAPLVPFADYILFRNAKKNRVLLNLGGIANITWLPAGGKIEEVIAFDTGPGNCISDYLMRKYDPDGLGYDNGGQRALEGDFSDALAKAFLADPYFTLPPPKSTDGPQMIATWERAVERSRCRSLPLDALLATACYVAAGAISEAVLRLFPFEGIEMVASGGGTRNAAIMDWLEDAADHVLTTEALGVPSDAKEAIAFALLAAATLDGIPSNVPTVTGAKRAVVLGSITPRP